VTLSKLYTKEGEEEKPFISVVRALVASPEVMKAKGKGTH